MNNNNSRIIKIIITNKIKQEIIKIIINNSNIYKKII
jgi:hypothetical protein